MTDPATRSLRHPFPDPPAPGEAVEVAPGILWLRCPLPMALDHVNLYALDDGDGWTLIDAGMAWPKGVAAVEAALAGPLGGRPVRRVILTHHHPDHIGLAGRLARAGAEIATTRTAYLTARMLTLDVEEAPPTETLTFWRRGGMAPEILDRRRGERPFNFADIVDPIPLGHTRLKEGDRLRGGGRDWSVRIGDGHAPEHATLWSEDGIVLTGDQVIASISPNLSLYPTEPEADPVGAFLESCRRLATYATEDQLALPGHKLPFRGLPTRLAQLVENHEGVLARLTERLRRPATAAETFAAVFKREIGPGEYGLALGEAHAHCHHLFLAGRATRTLRDDGAYLFAT
ncbi:MAG: MBL fold metallo-hydrolase [Shimia sp.]